MNRTIILIVHNIRSSHNVGSLLRTAEGIAVSKVYFTGYTPYPVTTNDQRLPHEAQKLTKQISKTALGAEHMVHWEHIADIQTVVTSLKQNGFEICGLEQSERSKEVMDYTASDKVAMIIGNEVNGIDEHTLSLCDVIVEIPMLGQKESFNVVQATAMLLYRLRFLP